MSSFFRPIILVFGACLMTPITYAKAVEPISDMAIMELAFMATLVPNVCVGLRTNQDQVDALLHNHSLTRQDLLRPDIDKATDELGYAFQVDVQRSRRLACGKAWSLLGDDGYRLIYEYP